MTRRLMQAALTLVLTACGGSPSATAQQGAPAKRPFSVTPIADFDTPWAMTFLPGSGVRMTNAALVSERDGRLWLVDAASGTRLAMSSPRRISPEIGEST